ncbi:hypothetical protein DFH09DRAFT_923448 [Mycena vulgaris]|nr:hypothetical protein DFH09DRAFT_923448 [Mycena vulgaris]
MPQLCCRSCGKQPFVPRQNLFPDLHQKNHLRDILRTHTVPPDTSHLRRVISAAPYELERHDKEIKRLQKQLKRLLSRRAALASYAHGCRSAFSPIRRLPAELLVEIFEMCSPPSAEDISPDITPSEELHRLAKHHLLQLSQVCSRWHDIAMSTPRLWSKIVVQTSRWTGSTASSAIFLGLLASSLQRGGNFPLTIALASSYPFDGVEGPVLTTLALHSQRWRDVHFDIDPRLLLWIACAKGNLLSLEILELRMQIDLQTEVMVDVFEVAPRLRALTLGGWASKFPRFPWEHSALWNIAIWTATICRRACLSSP